MIPGFLADYAAPVVVATAIGIFMIYAQYFSQEELRGWIKDMNPRIVNK